MELIDVNPTNGFTNCLIPGYVRKGFSYARAEMYKFAETQNKYLGIPVILLSKTSEIVEFPLRAIEDVALTAINLLGAIISEGCRNNLNAYLLYSLGRDVVDAVATVPLVLFPLYRYAYIGAQIAKAIWNVVDPFENNLEVAEIDFISMFKNSVKTQVRNRINEIDPTNELNDVMKREFPFNSLYDELKQEQLDEYYRISAIQKHGYHNIKNIVEVGSAATLDDFVDYQAIENYAFYKVHEYEEIAKRLYKAYEISKRTEKTQNPENFDTGIGPDEL